MRKKNTLRMKIKIWRNNKNRHNEVFRYAYFYQVYVAVLINMPISNKGIPK